jgi:23S rRNA pseudouridine1911/1915/1917 synthase
LSSSQIQVLYEDNHLLVLNKPAPLATMGAATGVPTAVTWAADYIKRKYNKPGNVFIGVVSRLDSFVTGVLILARTSKAASRLTEQFRERTSSKKYLVCVEGNVQQPEWNTISLHMLKNDAAHRMVAVSATNKDAQEARLRFRTLASTSNAALLEVDLLTGRKHQIRLQFSDLGHPIFGDTKYGAKTTFPAGIALHSQSLTVAHPTLGKPMTFVAPLPKSWQSLPAAIRNQEWLS